MSREVPSYPPDIADPTSLSSLFVIGSALALIGWAHLTSPPGPDFRQALVKVASRVSQSSSRDEQTRDQRIRILRRKLASHGFRLVVARHRAPSPELGGFLVVEFATKKMPIGGEPVPFSASLETVEAWASRLDAGQGQVEANQQVVQKP